MTCLHRHIQTWHFTDGEATGEPAGMWSCSHCGQKFEPLDVDQWLDAMRYRWLRRRKVACAPHVAIAEKAAETFDQSVDDAMGLEP
jgi:hypothetical protein